MDKNHFLFTSESVSQGHPDKICDQLCDSLNDYFIAFDPNSHCAIEAIVTTGQVIIAGEVKSEAYVDIQEVVRDTINKIGYTKSEYQFDGNSCGILNAIHEQSPDIDMGVTKENPEDQGAGDQGIFIAYGTNEWYNYMPATIDIAHMIVKTLAEIRENEPELMPYLRPDAKSQVTIEYDENCKPIRIDTIVVSTQHDEFDTQENMQKKIREDIINIVIPKVKEFYYNKMSKEKIDNLFADGIKYFVNPTGVFIIGGPTGDTGLTSRKLIVDTWGGWGSFGGGGFSGKDMATKTDRSCVYFARYIAKNCIAAGLCDRMLIQLSYAIGVADCLSIFVDTYGTNHTNYTDSEIAEKLRSLFDFRPYCIAQKLKLNTPIAFETAAYGHFGREPKIVHKHFGNKYGPDVDVDVELFTWEKLDAVEEIQNAFFNNTAN